MSIFEIIKKLRSYGQNTYGYIWALFGPYLPYFAYGPYLVHISPILQYFGLKKRFLALNNTYKQKFSTLPDTPFMSKIVIFLNEIGHNSECTFCTIAITKKAAFFNILGTVFLHRVRNLISALFY